VVTDGTAAGTHILKGPASLFFDATKQAVAIGARLLFIGTDGKGANLHGSELWTSDGTAAGTVMLKDINPRDSDSNTTFQFLNPPTVVNGTLYFTANDGVHGVELWKSDGTAAGTMMVKDINPGPSTSFPSFFPQLTNINGTVYFEADDGVHGVELWRTDGTADGTVMIKDIDPGSNSSGSGALMNVGGTLYFAADDGAHGDELWKSDGTDAGTVMVEDIDPGALNAAPNDLTIANGAIANNVLYFTADDGIGAGAHGNELWMTVGTIAGARMVKDINPGPGNSNPSDLTNDNGLLYFTAFDGSHGEELWTATPGSIAGAEMVADINPGSGDSNPSNLTPINGFVYFTADNGVNGVELWKSGGNALSTVTVKDIDPGRGASNPFDLTNADGTLYFFANNGDTDGGGDPLWQLWKSDGTAAGTVMVKEFDLRRPTDLKAVNGGVDSSPITRV